MPNSTSARKRVLTSEKCRLINKARKSSIKTAEKKLRVAVQAGDKEKAREFLSGAFAKLDKAAKGGTIHRRKSDRKKSRLAQLLKEMA